MGNFWKHLKKYNISYSPTAIERVRCHMSYNQICKTLTHQLMMIIYWGTAHVVNLSNQNEVIILITSLLKPSSVSLCVRGKLYHSHIKASETRSRASSHWARERRGRGESMGRLMAIHAGVAVHAEKSHKWLPGPNGLEPEIWGTPEPSELWFYKVLGMTYFVVSCSWMPRGREGTTREVLPHLETFLLINWGNSSRTFWEPYFRPRYLDLM